MGGELDLAIVDAGQPARRIDVQPPDVTGAWWADAFARGAPPPQQRADARDELANPERLGQIVVGPALEAVHLVRFLAPRGQHQDRHVLELRLAPDRAASP